MMLLHILNLYFNDEKFYTSILRLLSNSIMHCMIVNMLSDMINSLKTKVTFDFLKQILEYLGDHMVVVVERKMFASIAGGLEFELCLCHVHDQTEARSH
jgi:hypothetical protein